MNNTFIEAKKINPSFLKWLRSYLLIEAVRLQQSERVVPWEIDQFIIALDAAAKIQDLQAVRSLQDEINAHRLEKVTDLKLSISIIFDLSVWKFKFNVLWFEH